MPEPIIPNTGLLRHAPSAKDWVLGGISGLERRIVRPDGDWRPFKSEPHEMQLRFGHDYLTCTKFAALDAVEAFMFAVYGTRVNYSERALAIFAQQPSNGDTLTNVAETIRKMGLVPEEECPWTSDLDTFEKYMALPPGELERLKAIGQEWLKKWKFGWEWVYDNGWGDLTMEDALKMSPIFAAGLYASESSKDAAGVYHSQLPNSDMTTHAFTLLALGAGGRKFIDDSYGVQVKELADDFRVPLGLRIAVDPVIINPTPMPAYKFEEDTMYFVAESKGFEVAFLAGKVRYDDPVKLRGQVSYRTGGDTKGRYKTISPRELAGVTVYDLKDRIVDVSSLMKP